jgi:hypothetical protein
MPEHYIDQCHQVTPQFLIAAAPSKFLSPDLDILLGYIEKFNY